MELIGTVVRLQVQRSRLKPLPAKAYDPSPLLEVEALAVGPRGCTGLVGQERVLDVHSADHPDSRNVRLGNGLSLMSLAAYASLRSRFGDALVDGVAGESLLLDGELPLAGEVHVETTDGVVVLPDVGPMPPCVGFSCWCLGREGLAVDDEVRAAMAALGGGARGSTSAVVGEGVVAAGARVWRA